MTDLRTIAPNLERSETGIWCSKQQSRIAYPSDGNVRNVAIEDNSFWYRHRNECIVQMLRLFPPQGPLFDVGGGNGYVARGIQQAGFEVVLVEPGPHGAANARQRGVDLVICATMEDAGFQPHVLPAVGLFDVLEHIQDDVGFLQTVGTRLVPGGYLYVSVPAYNCLWSTEDDHAQHCRRYTLRRLATALATAGFEVAFQTYIFQVLPFPILFSRVIPGRLGLRKESTFGRYQQENTLPANWLGRLVERSLARELAALRGGRPIPFGGSCLVAARTRPA